MLEGNRLRFWAACSSHTRQSHLHFRCYFPAPRARSERKTSMLILSHRHHGCRCRPPSHIVAHMSQSSYRFLCAQVRQHRYILKEKDTPSPCCCCVASWPRMSADKFGTSWDQRVSMVQHCFTSTETVRLIRTESPGRPPRLSHSSWTLTLPSPVSKHGV